MLVEGERLMRSVEVKAANRTYTKVANKFEELGDFETASYFYQRCLDISIENKYLEGEARAY